MLSGNSSGRCQGDTKGYIMYVWTVRGAKLEDVSIIFDNDTLRPISNDLHIIQQRMRRRERMYVAGMRKRKRRRKNVQSKTK